MTYNQLLQSIEFWAGFNSGDISGDSGLKETFTHRLNRKLERYLGMLGAGSRLSQVDDTNYSEHPFSLFNIVEDQHDYEFLADEDGNVITDITAVLIKPTGGVYRKIDKVTIDDQGAELIMSPNAKPGVPTRYLERNNTIFLDPIPNYNLSYGGKLFYKRAPSYFATTDTTKEPGIPVQFHEMLAIASAYDWLLVHKSNAGVEITRAEAELDKFEREFRTYNELRSPQRNKITIRQERTR
jgi:hypothetical protein